MFKLWLLLSYKTKGESIAYHRTIRPSRSSELNVSYFCPYAASNIDFWWVFWHFLAAFWLFFTHFWVEWDYSKCFSNKICLLEKKTIWMCNCSTDSYWLIIFEYKIWQNIQLLSVSRYFHYLIQRSRVYFLGKMFGTGKIWWWELGIGFVNPLRLRHS